MSGEAPSSLAASQPCPACNAPLAADAVLCVACGYHLKLGRHLATMVDRPAPVADDDNPYASPRGLEGRTELAAGERPDFDLTDAGARAAKAIVSDAQNVTLAILAATCFCGPAWLIMLPWYGYRLFSWYQLNRRFAELRSPNSFSPHGALAADFQDAREQLIRGIVVGCVFWVIVGFAVFREMRKL